MCDVIITEAKERFTFPGHIISSVLFSSDKFPEYERKFPTLLFTSTCEAFKFLIPSKLQSELETVYAAHEFRTLPGVLALHQFLKENQLTDTFSEIVRLTEAIPMSSSEAERCFSTLKRIKTFLRNTMSEDRLSALALLSIEKKMIMDIPNFNQKDIDRFAMLKERRMDFNYK